MNTAREPKTRKTYRVGDTRTNAARDRKCEYAGSVSRSTRSRNRKVYVACRAERSSPGRILTLDCVSQSTPDVAKKNRIQRGSTRPRTRVRGRRPRPEHIRPRGNPRGTRRRTSYKSSNTRTSVPAGDSRNTGTTEKNDRSLRQWRAGRHAGSPTGTHCATRSERENQPTQDRRPRIILWRTRKAPSIPGTMRIEVQLRVPSICERQRESPLRKQPMPRSSLEMDPTLNHGRPKQFQDMERI